MVRLINTLVLVLATTAALLLCSNSVVDAQCRGDVRALIAQCSRFVQKSAPKADPSPDCCVVIRSCDIPCICKNIPKQYLDLIDMDKVKYVTDFCGTPLAPGTKCGAPSLP